MASLIPEKTQKTANTVPRNQNEAKILKARAGHAALAEAFAAKPARKSAEPAAPTSTSFVSGFGGASNMAEPVRTKNVKSDPLAGLPERARRAADPLAKGQKTFLALVYERHAKTSQPVSFTKADAGYVMGLPSDAAGRAVTAMVSVGLLTPRLDALGGIAGYIPTIA